MKDSAIQIEVVDRPAMNLLGLLLDGLLRDNLTSDARRRLAQHLQGDLRVQAGKMTVTLRLERGKIRILSGEEPGSRAWVRGSLGDMLDLLTLSRLAGPILSRHVTFGGNLLWLSSVLPLLIPNVAIEDRVRRLVPRRAP